MKNTLRSIFLSVATLVIPLLKYATVYAQEAVALETADITKALKAIPSTTVTVEDDPFYGGRHTYRGYPLKAVLAALFSSKILAEEDAEIVFSCRDGYRVALSPTSVPIEGALLAFEETSAPTGKRWIEVDEGREKLSPEPYALVWNSTIPEAKKRFPWPIAIVSIEVVRKRSPAEPLDSKVLAGYAFYKSRCQQCHSMNLDGGIVGPELNVPKNITEYWGISDLRALIRDPSSYRFGSRMPPFPDLSEDELSSVIEYLQAMKTQKVCSSKADCEKYVQQQKKL